MPYDPDENGSAESGRDHEPFYSPNPDSWSLKDFVALPVTFPPLLPFLCTLPLLIPGVILVAALVFVALPQVYAALLNVRHSDPAGARQTRDYIQRVEDISKARAKTKPAGKQLWRENLARLLEFSRLEKVLVIVPVLIFAPLVFSIFFVKPALYEALVNGLKGFYTEVFQRPFPGDDPGKTPDATFPPEPEPTGPLAMVVNAASVIVALGAGAIILFIVGAFLFWLWLGWLITTYH